MKTSDFMTTNWAPMPYPLLAKVSSLIINEGRGTNRVVYGVSSKPSVLRKVMETDSQDSAILRLLLGKHTFAKRSIHQAYVQYQCNHSGSQWGQTPFASH